MEYIGKKIKTLRRLKGYSQHDLAQGICCQSELSKIENSKLLPSLPLYYEITKKLNVKMDDLINDDFNNNGDEKIEILIELFYKKKFSKCLNLINHLNNSAFIHNKQVLYYIHGGCCYYVYKDLDKSIELLEDALHETYTNFKKKLTSIEIQILNLLGFIYEEHDKYKYNVYLEESLNFIESKLLYKDIHYRALSKCYYNVAKIHMKNLNFVEAQNLILKGIEWCTMNQTLYYLVELYQLLSIVYRELGEKSLVNRTKKIVNTLSLINDTCI